MKQVIKWVLIATLLVSFVSLPAGVARAQGGITNFFLTVIDAQITFVKDDKGQVTHLVLHQNKIDQPAKKIK